MSDQITQLVYARLNSSLGKAFSSQNNITIPSTVLTSVVPQIASSISTDSTKIVSKEANYQLNEIPKNLVGSNNPVNIVSGNLSTASLSDTLKNNINPSVNNDIKNVINNKVDEILRLNLTGTVNNNLLDSIKNNILGAVQKDVNSIVNLALNGFSSGVLNTGVTIPPVVSDIDNLFSDQNSDLGLERYDEQYNSALVNKALLESQRFDPVNQDNVSKLEVTQRGFSDPTATYPTEEYKNRPDTNKLATGDVNGTVVQKKNDERMIGAKLPGDSSWSQPESPYKGEYPFNKVTQTEQGHIIEIDDTPGAERLHIYHKTGTFIEIDSNGSVVKRTKGSNYEIIDRNGYISIAGKADISINGACNIFVGNDANIEVEGDTNITCHNDVTAQAGGTFRLSAVESFSIRSANVFIEADNELNLLSGTFTKSASDIIHYKANTATYLTTKDYFGKIENDNFLQVANDFHSQIGNNFNLDTGGIVDINNGSATESKPAVRALNSYAGLLQGRKDINYIDLADPLFLTVSDTYVLTAEEPGDSEKDINSTKNNATKSGLVTKEKFLEAPVPLESETPKTTNNLFVTPGSELKNISEAPDNFSLSPNFTLAMLSSKSAVTKNKLVAQSGKSYGELLFNLSAVALNICEPVLKLYPNMYVTSAFRLAGKSSSTSQHPLGQAVDIQFKGVSKKEYYEIAKILASKLNYDQLLLEYAATTNNPWIHISLDVSKNNRIQVMTFNDHRKYADGLSQLA